MTKEQYYAFYLDDPACASFCSFSKLYVGTLSDLAETIRRTQGIDGYQDTNEAFEAFLNGCKDAKHFVAQHYKQLLTPVDFRASSELSLGEREWEHINTWRCPYNMKFDKAEIKQIIVKHEGEYIRLIKATITNLCYENTVGDWCKIIDGFWGHSFLMDVTESPQGDVTITNILYVVESSSKLLREEKAKLTDEAQIIFDRICDEVFADG